MSSKYRSCFLNARLRAESAMTRTTACPRKLLRVRALFPTPGKVKSAARCTTMADAVAIVMQKNRAKILRILNLHDVRFLHSERVIDFLHKTIGQFLDLLLETSQL